MIEFQCRVPACSPVPRKVIWSDCFSGWVATDLVTWALASRGPKRAENVYKISGFLIDFCGFVWVDQSLSTWISGFLSSSCTRFLLCFWPLDWHATTWACALVGPCVATPLKKVNYIVVLVWLATPSRWRRRVWYNTATIFVLCCRNLAARSDFE